MPDFYTPVSVPVPPFGIDYTSKCVFMGSCFAENIGLRMQEAKFKVCHNPFGVIYNPLSMAKNLTQLVDRKIFSESDLFFYNELWFSYSHYTLFSDTDKNTCLEKINRQFLEAKKFIAEANVLFITLGTSWVFQLKSTGEVVNNCHKIPATKFDRNLSTVENSVGALAHAIKQLRIQNPSLKIVFTVSPIRHWKDGAIENQRSKSALILAISQLENDLKDVYYFPAYEIFMDELRDYRFYAADKLHPSDEAQNYIWKKFQDTFMEEETKLILKNVEHILLSVKHKPRFVSTQSYRKFIEKAIDSIQKLSDSHPFLDFNGELRLLGKV